MIVFNGIDLEERIPDIRIEDIDVSPIQINPISRPRPVGYGSEFVRNVGGTRTVTITFALLTRKLSTRENYLLRLRYWARPFNVNEHKLVLPHFSDRYLSCACSQLPDASYRKWWENKLRLVFTCYDNPFWTSEELMEVKCGTTFSVSGNAPPLMTIERSGSAISNATYATKSESMTFSRIPSGDMVIDLNRQTAVVGRTSIMSNYVPTSTWITPTAGTNLKITGNGTIKYRERWV